MRASSIPTRKTKIATSWTMPCTAFKSLMGNEKSHSGCACAGKRSLREAIVMKSVTTRGDLPMAKKKRIPAEEALPTLLQHAARMMDDPLDRFAGIIDIPTLNLIGEVALGETEEGTYSPRQLAEMFHAHLEKGFRNQVCDQNGDRENMRRCLETALVLLAIRGESSIAYPGYISIGTVLVKQDLTPTGKVFQFVRHPAPEAIYRC